MIVDSVRQASVMRLFHVEPDDDNDNFEVQLRFLYQVQPDDDEMHDLLCGSCVAAVS